jgi:hypothetical protein
MTAMLRSTNLLRAALQDHAGPLVGGDLAIEFAQLIELVQRNQDLIDLIGARVPNLVSGHLSLAGIAGEIGVGFRGPHLERNQQVAVRLRRSLFVLHSRGSADRLCKLNRPAKLAGPVITDGTNRSRRWSESQLKLGR